MTEELQSFVRIQKISTTQASSSTSTTNSWPFCFFEEAMEL
uniref:Uncharacterized protein n=1 Tax=Meloidogyne enterolobii TaxID=390850 RepID=A0A6V7X5R4_MELEN|nr:unnamed protein product [Meloidogyne enterolobii]CAD2194686.1 unnamed protein product [Meloidogyne enterolobii]